MLHQLTPTQREMHQARKARLARMSPQAFNAQLAAVDAEMSSNVVPLHPEPTLEEKMQAWVKRQLEMREWFKIASKDEPRAYPRIKDIQRVVARHYGVHIGDLLSGRRTLDVVRPRQIAAYLAKDMTPFSYPEIGRRFGGRDHSTILHAFRKMERLIREDSKLAGLVEEIRAEISA